MPKAINFDHPAWSILLYSYRYTAIRIQASKGEDKAKPKLFLGFGAGRLNLAERPGRQRHHSHPPAHSVLAGTGRAPSTHGPPQREWIVRLDWLRTALLLDAIQLLALDQARYSVDRTASIVRVRTVTAG